VAEKLAVLKTADYCAERARRADFAGSAPSHQTTMPGIRPITAVAYVAALEKPDTFKRSRAVGAWLASHRDASNQEKSITKATSRDAVTASCARSFTKPLLCS
jgi:transposase